MSKFIELPTNVWNEVLYWEVEPKRINHHDRDNISFNGDHGYTLLSDDLLLMGGLSCLEYHIFINLYPEKSDLVDALMSNIPFIICGPGGPTQKQKDMETTPPKLDESAPIEYLDQPKVLEAILSLEKKGHITIIRNKS